MKFKYELNETVYLKGCGYFYQKLHPITIKYRECKEIKLDGDDFETIKYNSYSEDGIGWYPESAICNESELVKPWDEANRNGDNV